jgi:hypothetical protein
MRKLSFVFCVAVLAMMFAAVGSFAATTDCTYVVTKGTTPSASSLKLAVASNFYEPAKDMIGGTVTYADGFLDNTSVTNITVTICHNSTTTLKNEILANSSLYDMLFAADNTADDVGTNEFTYAIGTPVFFGLNSANIPNIGALIQQTLSGTLDLAQLSGTINGSGTVALSPYNVKSTLKGIVSSVSVAGTGAPYGRAGRDILNNMEGWTPPANPSMSDYPPNWIYTPLWGNIDQTFDSVNSNQVDTNGDGVFDLSTPSVRAGFGGKSQICSGINIANPTYVYVEFLGYQLEQTASIVNASTLATNLRNYIVNGGSTWEDFLEAHCYDVPE